MQKLRTALVILCALFFQTCGGQKSSFDFAIALDPVWHSLELSGRETALTAFTIELITAVGKIEKLTFAVYQKSYNDLVYGLQQQTYDAICSTMRPYLFFEKTYTFSELYLMTGPVLVVPKELNNPLLSQLDGKIVGIIQGSNSALILEKYPQIIQRTYSSVPDVLQAVSTTTIDAAVVNVLTAEAFTQNLFQNRLKIGSPPLTQEGLRLISLQGPSSNLIFRFNRGLKKLKENGTYSELLKKWGFETG
jgi:polar amino acid transport system substrate-binding protein